MHKGLFPNTNFNIFRRANGCDSFKKPQNSSAILAFFELRLARLHSESVESRTREQSPKRVLFVIDHDETVQDTVFKSAVSKLVSEARRSGVESLSVLSFCDGQQDGLRAYCQSLWQEPIEWLDAGEQVQAISVQAQQAILDGVHALGQAMISCMDVRGRAGDRERCERDWQYTELAEKNSPGSPLWWRMVRIFAVQTLCRDRSFDQLLYLGRRDVGSVMHQIAQQEGMGYSAHTYGRRRMGVMVSLMRRVVGLLQLTVAAAMARALTYRTPPSVGGLQFYTWFPRIWHESHPHEQDRYLGNLVERLRADGHVVWYIGRLFDRPDGVPVRTMWKRFLRARRDQERLGLIVLERSISMYSVIQAWLNLRSLKYVWRAMSNPAVVSCMQVNGLSYRSLLLPRLVRSLLVHVPLLNVLEAATFRLTCERRPRVVTTYCFEYMYGRAIVAGVHGAASTTKVFGLQHGPISPMKWLYWQLERGVPGAMCPDHYLLDGAYAKQLLEEGGVDPARISVSGAVRLDAVWSQARKSHPPALMKGRMRILVAPGLHDTELVLAMVREALLSVGSWEIVIKSHPKVSIDLVNEIVRSWGTDSTMASVQVVRDGSLYEWIESADVFVSSYSSAGVEAIAFGVPVVYIRSGSTPDMSVFFDCDQVHMVSTPPDLYHSVAKLMQDADAHHTYVQTLSALLEHRYAHVRHGDAMSQLQAVYARA